MKKLLLSFLIVLFMLSISFAGLDVRLEYVSNSSGTYQVKLYGNSDTGSSVTLQNIYVSIDFDTDLRTAYTGYSLSESFSNWTDATAYGSGTLTIGLASGTETITASEMLLATIDINYNQVAALGTITWGSTFSATLGTVPFSNMASDKAALSGDFTDFPLNDAPLPVNVSLFEARYDVDENGVELKWRVESEIDCAGYQIWRSENQADYTKVSGELIEGRGTDNTKKEYSFVDYSVESDKEYWYQIEEVSINGASHNSFIAKTMVSTTSAPYTISLSQNYPNPFNPTTAIRFTLSEQEYVTLTIFDLLGSKVKTLVSENLNSGEYSVQWNGYNEQGQATSSGVYFYKLETADNVLVKKLTKLK